ncbi:hypothetical protein FN846DRAFT_293807 [Sphaerosporella brunnea]|uniref:Uncharacterized protein n=1 Tax=Sphaerosporella brunnea TaxID=1250544 RepID=A0A5J5EM18_9PEZI|nr:hypothetical protein FN846DRAFT_293807 [Sphaerosporella brunnea]
MNALHRLQQSKLSTMKRDYQSTRNSKSESESDSYSDSDSESEILTPEILCEVGLNVAEVDSANEDSTRGYRIQITSETLMTAVGLVLETTDDGIVHLIHQSAKEFITQNNVFARFSFFNVHDDFELSSPISTLPKIASPTLFLTTSTRRQLKS